MTKRLMACSLVAAIAVVGCSKNPATSGASSTAAPPATEMAAPAQAAAVIDICGRISTAQVAHITGVPVVKASPDPGPFTASCGYKGEKDWDLVTDLQLFENSDTEQVQKTTEGYKDIDVVPDLGQKAYWNKSMMQLTVVVKPGTWLLVNTLNTQIKDPKATSVELARTMISTLNL